jgi:rRNA-processing protein EBP2
MDISSSSEDEAIEE